MLTLSKLYSNLLVDCMKKVPLIILLSILLLSESSCIFEDRNEHTLSKSDLSYLRKLGVLGGGEKIEMFESNAGFKRSGNFITDKRIASYWIDGKKDEIHSAEYSKIDSIKMVDRTRTWTYSSYLEIYHAQGNMFEVYVDADSLRTWEFFNRGMNNWRKVKKQLSE